MNEFNQIPQPHPISADRVGGAEGRVPRRSLPQLARLGPAVHSPARTPSPRHPDGLREPAAGALEAGLAAEGPRPGLQALPGVQPVLPGRLRAALAGRAENRLRRHDAVRQEADERHVDRQRAQRQAEIQEAENELILSL